MVTNKEKKMKKVVFCLAVLSLFAFACGGESKAINSVKKGIFHFTVPYADISDLGLYSLMEESKFPIEDVVKAAIRKTEWKYKGKDDRGDYVEVVGFTNSGHPFAIEFAIDGEENISILAIKINDRILDAFQLKSAIYELFNSYYNAVKAKSK